MRLVVNRFHGWRHKIGAVALGLLLGAGASEALLREMLPATNRFYLWPPNMTAVLRPAPPTIPGITGPSHFSVNSLGVRGREPKRADRREYRIFTIGGSTTECLFLDDAKTWPHLLQETLKRTADGRDVWIGNIGKSGTTTRDHMLQLRHLLPQHPRIDLVLALVGINDLNWRLRKGDKNLLPPERQLHHAFAVLPTSDPWAFASVPSSAPWYKRTAIYGLLRKVRAWLETSVRLADWQEDPAGHFYEKRRAERATRTATLDELPDLTSALIEYAANLNVMIDLTEEHGARIVLMTQPVMWRADLNVTEEGLLWNGWSTEDGVYYSPRALAAGMELYNRELLRVCTLRGITCIDLAALVPRTAEIFYDDAHYTEKGASVVAKVVSEHLASRGPFAHALGAHHDHS